MSHLEHSGFSGHVTQLLGWRTLTVTPGESFRLADVTQGLLEEGKDEGADVTSTNSSGRLCLTRRTVIGVFVFLYFGALNAGNHAHSEALEKTRETNTVCRLNQLHSSCQEFWSARKRITVCKGQILHQVSATEHAEALDKVVKLVIE